MASIFSANKPAGLVLVVEPCVLLESGVHLLAEGLDLRGCRRLQSLGDRVEEHDGAQTAQLGLVLKYEEEEEDTLARNSCTCAVQSRDLNRVLYHSHLLHLAHEFDEDPVEDLADTGQVRIRSGSEETDTIYILFSSGDFLVCEIVGIITK